MKKALFWKLLERFGIQGSQFVLQIILARLLEPKHYGVLALMAIFTTLANVFIQTGFNIALIQKKDIEDEDYSSVLWCTMLVATIFYILLYIIAPIIEEYYQTKNFVLPFRIMLIMLFPGAINSIQIAIVSRSLEFKSIFKSNIVAVLISGIMSIVVAFYDGGIWALVIQNVLMISISTFILSYILKWKPTFCINFNRVKELFSYGWKLLISNLLENLYVDLVNLIIGKRYDSSVLGLCARGKQFPQFIMNGTGEAIKSVLLPVMAKMQDEKDEVKDLLRKSVLVSSFVLFPILFGLAAISKTLILFLLTEKWIFCVTFMKLYCFAFAFSPVHACCLQAVNAIGRSDIYLKLELFKRAVGILLIIFATYMYDSPELLVLMSLVTAIFSTILNAVVNKVLFLYLYKEQIYDIVPPLLISIFMYFVVANMDFVILPLFAKLMLQIACGIIIYIILSVLTKSKGLHYILSSISRNNC